MVKSFLSLSGPLNDEYLPLYNSDKGRKILINLFQCMCHFHSLSLFLIGATYNETLKTVKESFPQYISELEGIADGAEVEFYKVAINNLFE